MKPKWWFKTIHEGLEYLTREPSNIEYLLMWTGETFIHTRGTAFWDHENAMLDVEGLARSGITHWREKD